MSRSWPRRRRNTFGLIWSVLPDHLTPQDVFAAWQREPHVFWLDSGADPGRLGRYSFVGCDPIAVLSSRGTKVCLQQGGREEVWEGDPFAALSAAVAGWDASGVTVEWSSRKPGRPPLVGGAVGYLAYDLCRFVERIRLRAAHDLELPEMWWGFYDVVAAFDHLEGRGWLIGVPLPLGLGEAPGASGRLEERFARRLAQLKAAAVDKGTGTAARTVIGTTSGTGANGRRGVVETGRLVGYGPVPWAELRSTFTREAYEAAVRRAKAYIAAGDIYQVNLAQRFSLPVPDPPPALYARLRSFNPAPFAAYLDVGESVIASVSPERFMRFEGDRVETRPIKGTRPRGRSDEEDRALRCELLASDKDRAEHVMIVDLERNDLGRFCRYGTVRVSEFLACEGHPTIWHLVSTVEGRLRPGADRVACIRACFPGGSITGAPKVRAMEIIDELEPVRRGVYTGAIGYLGLGGSIDLNIAIRTVILRDGWAHFHVGGGILADSDPALEYEETLHKGTGIALALLGRGVPAKRAQR